MLMLLKVVVGGGGGRNTFLMERIQHHLTEDYDKDVKLYLNEEFGINRYYLRLVYSELIYQ